MTSTLKDGQAALDFINFQSTQNYFKSMTSLLPHLKISQKPLRRKMISFVDFNCQTAHQRYQTSLSYEATTTKKEEVLISLDLKTVITLSLSHAQRFVETPQTTKKVPKNEAMVTVLDAKLKLLS